MKTASGRTCTHQGCMAENNDNCCADCMKRSVCIMACRNRPWLCNESREPAEYRVLSFRQPWAQLIVTGKKKIETCPHPSNFRGRIAIYVAKVSAHTTIRAMDSAARAVVIHHLGGVDVSDLEYGCIIGTVMLTDCVYIEDLQGTQWDTYDERMLGNWTSDKFGYVLQEPEIWPEPIHCCGKGRSFIYRPDTSQRSAG